jgi:hypothetical protein
MSVFSIFWFESIVLNVLFRIYPLLADLLEHEFNAGFFSSAMVVLAADYGGFRRPKTLPMFCCSVARLTGVDTKHRTAGFASDFLQLTPP